MRNQVVEHVKDMIRQKFMWPGGYTKTLVMTDGALLCHDCVRDNFKLICQDTKLAGNASGYQGWAASAVDVLWEGPDQHCDNCNSVIKSEYGDPESPCESSNTSTE